MPELPELEVAKRYVQSTSLHQQIEYVEVIDSSLLGNIEQNELKHNLKGEEIRNASRYGKYLCLELTNSDWFILHFGMTGRIEYYENNQKKPDYTKLLLRFSNNAYLSYVNIRKLGEINYSATIEDFINIKDLGPDFLDLTKEEFIELIKNRRGTIKYTLMQQKIIAGIGNEYSDEVLFQTRIHPEQSANELNEEQLESVYHRLKEIIEVAIENNTNFSEYPDDFLIPNRGKNGNCPICGEKLKRIKVSGRSAYICPNRQKKR